MRWIEDTLWRKQRVCMNLFIWLLLTALPLGERRLLSLYAWLYLHYSGMASWCITQSPAQVCPHVWARLQDNWTLLLPSLTLFPAWLQGPILLCTLYEIPLWAVKSKDLSLTPLNWKLPNLWRRQVVSIKVMNRIRNRVQLLTSFIPKM